MRFRNRLYQFMQGRNGVDRYARFLNKVSLGFFITAILFTILSFAFLSHEMYTASLVFRILYYVSFGIGFAFAIYWTFRVFSKNVSKRQKENTQYLYLVQKQRRNLSVLKRRWKDRKAYKYFKCPKCRQWMRAPKHKGKIRVNCSQCAHEFITKT